MLSIELLTSFGLLFGIFCINQFYCQGEILKNIVLGVNLFFLQFVIVAGILFTFDIYQLRLNLLIVLGLLFIANCVFCFINKRYYYKMKFDINNTMILLIMLFVLPFTINKFGFRGMGQDQGVYQTKAIALMYGDGKNQQEIEDYHLLNADYKKFFKKKINNSTLPGWDNSESINFIPLLSGSIAAVSPPDNMSAHFHGIPTFPALLALWGSIFGVANMMGIQTLFLLISLYLLYSCLSKLNIRTSVKSICTLAYAFSPIILWISRSAFTEMFLATIILTFIYYFLDFTKKRELIFSTIPILAFSYFHISIYTMVPLFVGLYLLAYVVTKNIYAIISSLICICCFFVGIISCIEIQPRYCVLNIIRPIGALFHIKYWTDISAIIVPLGVPKQVVLLITIVAIIAICAVALVWKTYRSKRPFESFSLNNSAIFKTIIRGIIILWVLFAVYYTYKFGFLTAKGINWGIWFGSGLRVLPHITVVSYIIMSGLISIPLICICLLYRPKIFLDNWKNIFVFVLFAYCIIFYSIFLRSNIVYYYYAARYIMPFISIIFIMFGIVLNRFKDKHAILAAMIIGIFYFPFDYTLAKSKDDSLCEWRIIENISSYLNKNGKIKDKIVIIDNTKLLRVLYLPLKYMSNALIFPGFMPISKIHADFPKKDIFILYKNSDELLAKNMVPKLIEKNTKYRADYDSERRFLSIPVDFYKKEEKIVLSYVSDFPNKFEMDFSKKDMPLIVQKIFGLSGVEKFGRWSDASISKLVEIKFAGELPKKFTLRFNAFAFANNSVKPCKLIVGDFIYDFRLNNTMTEIVVDIENNFGSESIKILPPDPISPKLLGIGDDNRMLGFALSNLTIIQDDNLLKK